MISRVLFATYFLILINFLVDLLSIISYTKASTSTSTSIYSTTSSSNAFAYIASIDVMCCWFLMLNSQWLQWKVFQQTTRENIWSHQTLAYLALIGYIFHGMFFMINGQTDFSQITDKPTSGLAAWLTFIVMCIAFFINSDSPQNIMYIHVLLFVFLLFSFMHSYVLIGLFLPFLVVTMYLHWRQPSSQAGTIIEYSTTDMCTILTVELKKQTSTKNQVDLSELPPASFFLVKIPFLTKTGHELYASSVVDEENKNENIKSRKRTMHFYVQANEGWSMDVYNLANEDKECLERKTSLEERLLSFESKLHHVMEHGRMPSPNNNNNNAPQLTDKEKEYVEKLLQTRIIATKHKIKKTTVEYNNLLKTKKTDPLPVVLQGPFGGFFSLPQPLIQYRYVVIFAEQIGIIPLTIYLNRLLRTREQNNDHVYIWLYWMCPEIRDMCLKYQPIASADEIMYGQFQPNFINWKALNSSEEKVHFQVKLYMTGMRKQLQATFINGLPPVSTLPPDHRFKVPKQVELIKNKSFRMKKILESLYKEALDHEMNRLGVNNNNNNNNKPDVTMTNNVLSLSPSESPPQVEEEKDMSATQQDQPPIFNTATSTSSSMAILYCGEERDGMYDTCVQVSKEIQTSMVPIDVHREPFHMCLRY